MNKKLRDYSYKNQKSYYITKWNGFCCVRYSSIKNMKSKQWSSRCNPKYPLTITLKEEKKTSKSFRNYHLINPDTLWYRSYEICKLSIVRKGRHYVSITMSS